MLSSLPSGVYNVRFDRQLVLLRITNLGQLHYTGSSRNSVFELMFCFLLITVVFVFIAFHFFFVEIDEHTGSLSYLQAFPHLCLEGHWTEHLFLSLLWNLMCFIPQSVFPSLLCLMYVIPTFVETLGCTVYVHKTCCFLSLLLVLPPHKHFRQASHDWVHRVLQTALNLSEALIPMGL